MRNITNINNILSSRSIDNGGDLNQLTADLPLNLILDDSTNDSINLGGLNSYGGAGKIIKVNINNDGLEYATETDTTYSAGTNINLNGTTINLNTNLTNLDTINTFKIGLSGIANASTLLRNSEVLVNDDYLQINSNGYVVGKSIIETKNAILGTDNTSGIIASTNITKSVDPNNGNITLTSTDTTYTAALPLTLSATNIIGLSGLTSYGNANQILKMNGTNTIVWSNETDTTYTVSTPLVLNNNVISLNGISGYGGGIGQSGKRQLIRTNANASALEYFDQPDFINSATLPLSISINGVISLSSTLTLDRINMNSTPIYLKTNDTNHYVKYSFDGVEVGGFGSNNAPCFKVFSTGADITIPPAFSPEVLAYYFRNYIQFEKNLWMNQKAIYFYLDINGLDYNHYIKYSGRDGALGCNGIQVGGYGAGNRACFEVVNTQPLANNPPTTPIVVFQVCPDKIITNQKLHMTSQPLYFKENGDINHYIKYTTTGDCMELGSYSNLDNGDPVFRFINTFNSEILVSLNKNNNVFNKTTFFTSELNSLSLIVSQDIYCRDITTTSFVTTPQLNVVNTSSTGTITAVNINATNIDTNTLDVALDIKLGAVDKHVYFTPDLFNRIKATSTGVTGGGILITGYDTVRLAEHVNSNRYVELTNATFTISDCDLIMDDYSKAFTCPKATFADTVLYINGRASICNTRIVNANGIVQIDCGRSAFSSEQSFDGMAIRKGTGSHLINFVNYDNTTNLGQIKATNTNILYEQSSDRRLKTNIVDMRSMIDKIMELKPREYNWIIDNEYDYGFIAQEVHTVFPQMREDVSCYCGEDMENMDMDNPIDKNGNPIYFGVDYGRFTPYIIKAFQELTEIVNHQQEQINQQQIIIDKLINSSSFANFKSSI